MFMYYNGASMAVAGTYYFETEEELNDFIARGTAWYLKHDREGLTEFIDPEFVEMGEVETITVEDAYKLYFG